MSGFLFWTTSTAVLGDHAVAVRVTDDRGLYADQAFTLSVVADTEAPAVAVVASTNLLNPGETVQLQVQASDNVGVVSRALHVNGEPLPLDLSFTAQFTPATPGLYTVTATATDAAGNTATDTFTLRVFDPADTEFPTVSITSPASADVITYLTDVVGTASDPNLEFYRLEYARAGTDRFTTFFQSNVSVVDGVLGVFDPTMLLNDDYVIRLTAQDINGLYSTTEITVGLTANAKLGNFHLEFTDLQIPVAGIPITVFPSGRPHPPAGGGGPGRGRG